MKQLLQNIKTGKPTVEEVPIPTPHAGQALVKVSASLVSAGTERMMAKNIVDQARSRPDLVKQVIDKARREGITNTARAVSIVSTSRWRLAILLPARSLPLAKTWMVSQSASVSHARGPDTRLMRNITLFPGIC
jgi:hypothetical protein